MLIDSEKGQINVETQGAGRPIPVMHGGGLGVSSHHVVHSIHLCEAEVCTNLLNREDRMNTHKNARLTPNGRELLVERLERGEHPDDVACAMGISVRTV